ncbi:NAD(P)-dependent oxidoreductase [Streptomyces qaidamensis]|jgi:3-hydroxyisobutyrate dehydrogenase-like beta-hydroxyacid dehydrogenase|uniref:NAD(P)-dependent oxidoreductase n=1 Tax=Streptomyces qaidamensis TaxID=1783515 RepID=UPI0036EA5CED
MAGDNRTPVTVIGAGSMGRALAGAFLSAGHPTTVWNRTPARAEPLEEKGAVLAASVADAVAASELVVTCLTTFADTRAALRPADGALRGRALVTLNSGSPADARETAAWAGTHGARLLTGAVKNVPAGVGAPDTLLYYSGDRAVFEEYEATLRVLGGDTVHLGEEPDLAALYEMAVGAMLLPALVGFFQGAAAVQARGLRVESMVRFAGKWLDMIKALLPVYAAEIDRGDYSDGASSVDLFLAGAAHDADLAQEANVDTGWLAPLNDLLRRAAEAGHGPHSVSALTEMLRKGA